VEINQPKLFSTKTGEELRVAPELIPDLVSKGEAAFLKGTMVPVVDSSGSPVQIPAEELPRALTEGFSYEPIESQRQRALKEEYGDSPIRAGAEGLARGLSLGLSDVGLRALGVDREGLEARKEFNPLSSLGGEVVGAVAPAFLSGGTSAAGQAAAKGGAAALGKAAALTPAGLATRAGTAVTRGLESKFGESAAKSLAGKILESSVPMAAGSLVEGAAFTAGNVLSEAALAEDPSKVAEKALANIGMGAALGGGIGAFVGLGARALGGKYIPHAVSELDQNVKTAAQATDSAVNSPLISEAERKGFFEGLSKRGKDADIIEQAGKEFGVEVFPEQLSGSQAVKRTSAILDTSVSPAAIARNEMKAASVEKISKDVVESFGGLSPRSENEVGNQLKTQIVEKFDKAFAPSQELYKVVSENLPFVEVSPKAIQSISSNIKKVEKYNIQGSLENKVGNFVLKNLPNMKTAKDIQNLSQAVKDLVNPLVPAERRVGSIFAEKLENLVENSTIRAGQKLVDETGDLTLKAQVQTVLDAIPSAKKEYAIFRDKLDTFAKQLGRKSISGKAGFEEFIEELAPNRLLDRMFDKKDPRFLDFMQKEFPDEFRELISFKKSQMLQKAEKTGSLKTLFKEVGNLSPEVRAKAFSPLEIKRLNLAEKYLDTVSFARNPAFGNPSGTAFMSSAMQAFDSPQATLKTWARDAAIEKFIKNSGSDGASVKVFNVLSSLEKSAQKITQNIGYSVKGFLQKSAPAAIYLGSKAIVEEKQEKKEDLGRFYEKQSKAVVDAAQNPEALIENASAAFQDISDVAPKVAEAASEKAAASAMFLYEKMPKNPFSDKAIFSQKKWKPSDLEISKWKKYVDTVEDPMKALKDLRKGRMTIEQSETLKTVYPEIYSEVMNNFMEELPKLKEELPYQKRLQISLLFQVPTDYTLSPEFINQMQQAHLKSMQAEDGKQQGGFSPARADKLNIAESQMSGTDKIIYRA